MWWIIIIGIIFLIIKFANDHNELSNAVAKQGGMRKKYHKLVDFALACHKHAHIIKEDGTSITIGFGSSSNSVHFDIIQAFGSVSIIWRSTNIVMGNHKLKWEFNEFMDQEDMIDKINHDMDAYISNILKKYT